MANRRNFIKILLMFLFASSAGTQMFAQTNNSEFTQSFYVIEVLVFLAMISLIAVLFMYFGWKKDKPIESGEVTLWQKIKQSMTKAVPVEDEDEILMEDDYDGIKELDNRIPPWFTYLFYATIIFGIFYMLTYYVFKTGKLQAAEYEAEMKAANLKKTEMMAASKNSVTEENVKLLSDASALASGKQIFKSNCVPCHGPGGGGVVGPNLTDDYWIHGGGIKNIYKTIKNGVLTKGMPNWGAQFNNKQIQEVASYVISLHGTHPANAKPPQGKKWEGDKSE